MVPQEKFLTASFTRGARLWTSQNLMLFVHDYEPPAAATLPGGLSRCEVGAPPVISETVSSVRAAMQASMADVEGKVWNMRARAMICCSMWRECICGCMLALT